MTVTRAGARLATDLPGLALVGRHLSRWTAHRISGSDRTSFPSKQNFLVTPSECPRSLRAQACDEEQVPTETWSWSWSCHGHGHGHGHRLDGIEGDAIVGNAGTTSRNAPPASDIASPAAGWPEAQGPTNAS